MTTLLFRFHSLRLQAPIAMLILLLQRSPTVQWLLGAEGPAPSIISNLLRSALVATSAAAATHTLTGATTFATVPDSPAAATVGQAFTMTFSMTGTPTPAKSYKVLGTLPPGLSVPGINSSTGILNAATGTISGTPTTAGNYSVTIQAWDKVDAKGKTDNVQYGVDFVVAAAGATAPVITAQPASTSATTGGTASFSVTATGSPAPTYQWRIGGVNISGATSATLSLTNVQNSSAGTYSVVVTNSAGSVTSAGATLTVTAAATAPVITAQPASTSATTGGTASFSVTATGSPAPTYQWRIGGVNISGATSATLSLTNVQNSNAGTYSVVVTNSAGSVTSAGATLTVSATASAPTFTTQPASQTVTIGSSVTFTVAANGSPAPTFQWKKGGTAIGGATGTSLTIASASTGDAGSYTVVATNSAGTATSNPSTLGVLSSHLANTTVTTGHGATLSAANTSGSIQWQVSSDGGATWVNLANGGHYSGVTSINLVIANTDSSMNGLKYRFVATAGGTVSNGPAVTLTVARALLPFPTSITVDGSGNLFVGDANANTIQKVTSAGATSLVAGTSGTAGSTNGTGAAARFNQPNGLALLSNGTLIVSDTANATIRSISSSSVVTTLAGVAGSRGNGDGAASSATFSTPVGIARDASDALYVADAMNHTIRKITADGVVSTLAGSAGASGFGDGTGTAARFNFPNGIAVASTGVIYVADTTNNLIRKITSAGVVTTLAGVQNVAGSDDGTGSGALFNHPDGLAVDTAGNLYVADTDNSIIRRITPAGAVTTIAGLPTIAGLEDGNGTFALFNHPQALVVDASGNVFVADTGNAAIRKIDASNNVSTLALSELSTPPPVTTPTTTIPPSSPPPTGSDGGGGGSIDPGFLAALALLGIGGLCRRFGAGLRNASRRSPFPPRSRRRTPERSGKRTRQTPPGRTNENLFSVGTTIEMVGDTGLEPVTPSV